MAAAGLDATGQILQGDPKAVILDRAEQTKPSLLVLGSQSVSAVAHFLLGNVAANVLRHAPCPVLIARPKPRSGSFKVLLATDGSASSDAAARSVAARPWPAGSEFRVLSVLELHLPVLQALFEPPFVDSATMEAWRGDAMKRAEDAVAAAVAALSPRIADVSESISVLTDGPRKIILNEAKEWDADLIVLGSHGRTGADRFLLGSVSEGVATHADRSVEVIRG
jgi:nucleotide-binding universal stress UspA family protein